MNPGSDSLLRIENLHRRFRIGGRLPWSKSAAIKAVDGVSFNIDRGETLGLVGESGCGKSTLARIILRILEPTSGRIYYRNRDVTEVRGRERTRMRLRMQMIFQDPLGSLDPRMTIYDQITEPVRIHKLAAPIALPGLAEKALVRVGLQPDSLEKYPHQLSGGQRQRVVAARALALEPDLLVCDEPVSALDVSVQAQMINLLQDIQRQTGLTYLFISHDLRVVRHISHRVAIMYFGRLVEVANAETVFTEAGHPYTKALIAAAPLPDPDLKRRRELLLGEPPNPLAAPSGCAFHPRCRAAQPICRRESPPLESIGQDHLVACHLAARRSEQSRSFPMEN